MAKTSINWVYSGGSMLENGTTTTKTFIGAIITAASQGLLLFGVNPTLVNSITVILGSLTAIFLRDSNTKIEQKITNLVEAQLVANEQKLKQ